MRLTPLVLCLAVLTTPAQSATFLKIDGIPGDCRAPNHKEEIEIAGFRLAGKILSFTKKIDVASPRLFEHATTGRHIKSVVMTDGPDADPRRYRLEDVVVSAMGQRIGSPTAEEVSFTFARLTVESSGQSRTSANPDKPSAPTTSVITTSSPSANTGQSLAILMKADQVLGTLMNARSVVWALANPGGKVQLEPFNIQKPLDGGSDRWLQYATDGRRIPEVRLTLQERGADLFAYTLEDVHVFDYARTSSGETFKLRYGRIQVEFKAPPPAGTKGVPGKFSWDVKANKKV